MLIAVGSWPYIRGTLSPSPPGGPTGSGAQVVYPHVTPLCSATTTTTTVPPSERPPLPFGTYAPLPLLTLSIHTHTHARFAGTSLSFFNDGRELRSLPRACFARDVWPFFSHISSPVPWLRLIAPCDTFSGERRTYRLVVVASLNVGSCRRDVDRACLSRTDRVTVRENTSPRT